MREKHTEETESKGIFYDELEEFARQKIRRHLQDLWAQEVTNWIEREVCAKPIPQRSLGMTTGMVGQLGQQFHTEPRSEVLFHAKYG